MSELAGYTRSVWETLMAAASTVALFVAANFGRPDLLGHSFGNTVSNLLMPFLALGQSVVTASDVSILKKRLDVDTGTIAIIINIPMYIRFPASELTSANLKKSRGYESITDHELNYMCPLELRPAAAINPANAINTEADVHNAINTNAASAPESLNIEFLPPEDLEGIICPGPAADDVAINTNAATTALAHEELDFTQVLQLPKGIEERELLLSLGLAPRFKELSFLRSRNKVQTVVTALQASGYMLTVLQRAAQNLGISPVEAFVAFLCIIVCLQLLIELYACAHYQRPLLLHLNAQQIRSLLGGAVQPQDNIGSNCPCCRVSFVKNMSFLVILGLSMYYFVHYVHAYLICSLSALLFFLAHVVMYVYFSQPRCSDNLWALYSLLYVSSMILAVVSTIVDWKAFQEANQKAWYAWILPHVSS